MTNDDANDVFADAVAMPIAALHPLAFVVDTSAAAVAAARCHGIAGVRR